MSSELKRYLRQLQLDGFGPEKQEKLKEASLLIIGAGGLGNPVATYTAIAGAGKITIIDHDTVEETNLHRQPLFSVSDIGKPKAKLAAERIQALNSGITVNFIETKLTSQNAEEIICKHDIVADCTDNFSTRYIIDDICRTHGIPCVFGAIEGWHGQVSVFNFKGGPSYRCLFPEPPTDAPDCDTIGVIGTLPAVVGSLMANELIKCLTGIGEPLSGKLLIVDLLQNEYNTLAFNCPEQVINSERQNQVSSHEVEVSTEEYLQQKNHYQLIDIREEFEWEIENAGGENIPYHKLLSKPDILNLDKKYILVCELGNKSKILAKKLRIDQGLTNIYNLKGGIRELLMIVQP